MKKKKSHIIFREFLQMIFLARCHCRASIFIDSIQIDRKFTTVRVIDDEFSQDHDIEVRFVFVDQHKTGNNMLHNNRRNYHPRKQMIQL